MPLIRPGSTGSTSSSRPNPAPTGGAAVRWLSGAANLVDRAVPIAIPPLISRRDGAIHLPTPLQIVVAP